MRKTAFIFLVAISQFFQIPSLAAASGDMQVTLLTPSIGESVLPFAPFTIKVQLTGGAASTAKNCSDLAFDSFKFGAAISDADNNGLSLMWGIPNNSFYSSGGWFGYGWQTQLIPNGLICSVNVLEKLQQYSYQTAVGWTTNKNNFDDLFFGIKSGTLGPIRKLDIAWQNTNTITHNYFVIQSSGSPIVSMAGLTRGQVVDYLASFTVSAQVGDRFVIKSLTAVNPRDYSTVSCKDAVKGSSREGMTSYSAQCVIKFPGGSTDSIATVIPTLYGVGYNESYSGESVSINIGKQGDAVAAAAADKAAADKAAADKAAADKAAADKAAADKAAAEAAYEASKNSIQLVGVVKGDSLSGPRYVTVTSVTNSNGTSGDYAKKISLQLDEGGIEQGCGIVTQTTTSSGAVMGTAKCLFIPDKTSNKINIRANVISANGHLFYSEPIAVSSVAALGVTTTASNKSSLSFKNKIVGGKVVGGVLSGKLYLANDDSTFLPLANLIFKVCVAGNNPETEKNYGPSCQNSKTDSTGTFGVYLSIPPTFNFDLSISSLKIDALELDFAPNAVSNLSLKNSTYSSQQSNYLARAKADAAAAKKAEDAANQKAADAAFKRAYNQVLNTTVNNLFRLNFYAFMSPGNSMTASNAHAWCSQIFQFSGEIWLSWIDGCAKAAQILARRS